MMKVMTAFIVVTAIDFGIARVHSQADDVG
jgi:hypothetical protein